MKLSNLKLRTLLQKIQKSIEATRPTRIEMLASANEIERFAEELKEHAQKLRKGV